MALTDESNGNGFYMPVAPAYGYGGGNGGFGNGFGFGGDGAWLLLFLLLCGGGMWGGFGGFGGGMMWPMMMGMGGFGGIDYLYPWLNNSEHISDGFRDQQLNTTAQGIQNAVTSGFGDVQLGIAGLGRQICETGNGVSGVVRDGFYGAEVAAQGRHNALIGQLYQGEINALNRSFAEQTANTQGFNSVNASLADVKFTEATEACATRTASATNTRDIIDAQTRGTQAILDKLCALELDGVKAQLAQAQRENVSLQNAVNMATMQASQVQQTADIINGTYTRLSQCPVNSTPVYGNQPIFTCGGSCGCGGVA